MPTYNSIYTGLEIDAAVQKFLQIEDEGGIATQTDLSDYLTITNAANTYQTATQVNNAILAAFPVGSIYTSTVNVDPSTFIGGTWERIQDTFLLAAGTTYTAGDTGGSATVNHTHNYGIQYGGYYCDVGLEGDANSGVINYNANNNITIVNGSNIGGYDTTYNSGNTASTISRSGSAHYRAIGNTSYASTSNLPPYLVVYVWKRIS